jgi:hypothetical protein
MELENLFRSAKPPEGVGEHKYDHSAGATVALLKYGAGLPFNRLENLQGDLGIPLPASTQWEIVEKVADHIYPAYEEMVRQAAQGELFFNDDTTMKILSLINTQSEGDPSRKAVFTSAILANHDGPGKGLPSRCNLQSAGHGACRTVEISFFAFTDFLIVILEKPDASDGSSFEPVAWVVPGRLPPTSSGTTGHR